MIEKKVVIEEKNLCEHQKLLYAYPESYGMHQQVRKNGID